MMKYEVGKKYTRQCVVLNGHVVAILATHVGDISGKGHFHLDMQFAPDEFLRYYGLNVEGLEACPDTYPVEEREVECLREAPVLRLIRPEQEEAFLEIERSMEGKRMVDMVCPHQNCDLEGQTPLTHKNGRKFVVCPCHGLAWDVEAGYLLKRHLCCKHENKTP